jgi:hypothetical protein
MDPSKAKWSFDFQGKEVRVGGGLIRIGFLDGEGYQFVEDPEAALEVVRKFRPRVDIFSFVQQLSDTTPRYNYPMEWDNFATVRVTTFDEWMTNQVDFKVRNKVRKAAKNGVVVKEVPFDDALIHGISAIYNESPIRQGRQFPHYHKNLDELRRMKATFLERSIFIGAFFEDKLIGFIKLVTNEDRSQGGLMHILSMIQHRDKSPTNALVAQAVRSCAERGISYLWYANMSYGKKQGDSLAEFKRHNGFQKIEVPRYYMPLTVAGRLALQFGLHHGVVDWIPEPIAAQFRRLRSLWYARRVRGCA